MSEIKEINITRGLTINVNDQGDTITLIVDDQRFIDRFYGLIETFDKSVKQINSKSAGYKSERDRLKQLMEETRKIMNNIDELFGQGACVKIFGDIVPSPVLLADFFDQMIPITKAYTNERQQVIERKYNRSRKGARR